MKSLQQRALKFWNMKKKENNDKSRPQTASSILSDTNRSMQEAQRKQKDLKIKIEKWKVSIEVFLVTVKIFCVDPVPYIPRGLKFFMCYFYLILLHVKKLVRITSFSNINILLKFSNTRKRSNKTKKELN